MSGPRARPTADPAARGEDVVSSRTAVAALARGGLGAAGAARPGGRAWIRRSGVLPALLTCASCAASGAARDDVPALAEALQVTADEDPGADDGWPDLSEFVSSRYGFLPLALPITEPAVGYGLAGGLAFLSKPRVQAEGSSRPDITFVGGFGTDNDTRGVAAGDVRYWLDGRLQTAAGVIRSSVNLDFYGIGARLGGEPRRYNLETDGGLLQAKCRVADSNLWAGLRYAYASTTVTFEAPERTPGLPEFDRVSHVGGLTPSLTWDTRDNIFTPTEGAYVEGNVGIFAPTLGADAEFQRADLLAMAFRPLASRLFLGARGQAAATFGDAPFYLQPFVALRGVPVLRYQGEAAASVEAELRWQFWNRVSLVGFGGVGAAWNGYDRFERSQSMVSGGVGIRYELAREYGIHAGIDVAFADGSAALYIQIGSAWARP